MKDSQDKVRVAFYIRVSTDEQASKWYWLDYQLKDLEKLVDFKSNHDPAWITDKKHWYIDDGYSGWNLDRPAYKDMLKAAKNKEFDMIAVWKIDRMSRNLTHLLKTFEDLRSYGVSFFSFKENIDFSWPVWRLTFQIFWALAEFEREMIKSRTNEGKRASARQGNYIWNGIPYWYKRDKEIWQKGTRLEIVPNEEKIVKDIFNWFFYSKLHYAWIVKKLNDLWISKGVSSRWNSKWTKWKQWTIKSMLKNTTYVWLKIERMKDDEWDIEEIKVSTPTIISENLFDMVQIRIKELDEWENRSKRWGWENKYLLSRKIVDIETKKSFVWYKRQDGSFGYRRKGFTDEKTWKKYVNLEMPCEAIDKFVWGLIEEFIRRPEHFFKLFKKQVSTWDDIDRKRTELKTLIDSYTKKVNILDSIDLSYHNWDYDEERAERLRSITKKDIHATEQRINDLECDIDRLLKALYSEEVIKDISNKYEKDIQNLDISQKSLIAYTLIDRIYARKTNKNDIEIEVVMKFDPNNVRKLILKDELKNSTNYNKSNGAIDVSNVNGRERETRTHNPALPKRVR